MKKKGFTLIELLAVIVILAIIALIATPLVLKYIDKSNKEALRNSIYSIDRAILMKGTIDRKDKEYTSTDELSVKIKDTDIKISYIDGETRYYKVSNENYLLDVKKCAAKKYCTIEEIESIKNVIIHKSELFPNVEDSNPGIICGEGTTEDTTLTTCHIRSIEDLVALSTLVNKGTTFKDKTVELVYSLDFNNSKSYASRKVNDSLISAEGFTPIGTSKTFQGTFNGNDNTIKGLYINRPEKSFIGLFGSIEGNLISNLRLENFNLIGKVYIGGLVGVNKSSKIENIDLENINLKSQISSWDHIGGMIGLNNSGEIKNITAKNINITSGGVSGGLIGSADNIECSKVILDGINMNGNSHNGGLIGEADLGNIKQIKIKGLNLVCSGGYCGGIVGSNGTNIFNAKFDGDVYGTGHYIALAVGFNSGDLNNIVVSGNVGNSAYTGAIAGRTNGTAEDITNVTAVMLSGDVKGHSYSNRMVAALTNSNLNLLVSKDVLFNDKVIESTDITSKHGKSLDNMGKASQSEYEALGFEFESTDTNEAYWYFNENDELDLIIK